MMPEPLSQREEEAVAMSPMRRRIAQRLVEAQQTAALLTTFNEIDMETVISLREKHQALFQEKYQVKLGFMSFFVKAAIDALKLVPQVNAEIRGNDIVYRNYFDIGVAVGSGRGLVVPVLRHAEKNEFCRNRGRHCRLRPACARKQTQTRRARGWHFHYHQWWHLRFPAIHTHR